MGDPAYTDLTVEVHEDADTGYAEIGPVIEGVFTPIGRVNLGELHEKILEAGKAAADAAESKSGNKKS